MQAELRIQSAYPVQLTGLNGVWVLVAGAGQVASRKIEELAACGARIKVVAREAAGLPLDKVEAFERRGAVPDDIIGMGLVIAATDDREVNRALAEAARARGILVNAADDPEVCTFFAPAVVRRGPLAIAIGTGGESPLIAGRLRRLLDALLPEGLGPIATLLAAARRLGHRGIDKKGTLLRALADEKLARLVDRGDHHAALARLDAVSREEPFPAGSVAIAGAGPGGRAHLTLRALDRIHRAEVIIHDALVGSEVLAEALPGTRVIEAGRRCGLPGTTQEATTALMVREARDGRRVVRLHGGDPGVFGRGGEEIDALDAAGVPWELVPGVSAALAAPAAAGFTLTARGKSRGINIRTGHTTGGYVKSAKIPAEEETLVILMAHGGVADLMRGLIEEGRALDTPAAAISGATLDRQRVVAGTISTLAERVEAERLERPITFVVGEVARRAEKAAAVSSRVAA